MKKLNSFTLTFIIFLKKQVHVHLIIYKSKNRNPMTHYSVYYNSQWYIFGGGKKHSFCYYVFLFLYFFWYCYVFKTHAYKLCILKNIVERLIRN